MPKKKVFIETLGCQMNVADTERMLGLLDEIDYEQTEIKEEADLSVLNTCSIREHAVDKMRSYIGKWEKERKPGSFIAVGGCVAQERHETLQQICPAIDIVFGTHNLHRLPDLVLKAESDINKLEIDKSESGDPGFNAKKAHVCEIWEELPEIIPETPIFRKTKHYAWVNIIYGCNYKCTYCIVPQTRGSERSRPVEEIVKEVQGLADEGYKEVILLGQNVDGYGSDMGPDDNLANVLRAIHPIKGIERIKFLTSHPCDMTHYLIDTVAELPKVAKHFHMPIQAGNNEVLKRMARRYTFEHYMDLVNYMREKMPDVTITGDIIVGFPGESHEQFMDSVKAVQEIKYDACITAIYSKRPNTPAATWEDDISHAEKQERIRLLNSVITETAEKQMQRFLNRIETVLVEGQSARNPARLAGKTMSNKTVNFDCPIEVQGKYVGQFVDVHITKVNPWALRGDLIGLAENGMDKPIRFMEAQFA